MIKILAIFVAVASFLVVPALCMGGVIKHACECASETARACETEGEHESGCGHEGGCLDDPCSVRVVRPERQSDDVVTVSQPEVSTTIILTTVCQPSTRMVRAGTHEWTGGRKLPFPSSDLPLLI